MHHIYLIVRKMATNKPPWIGSLSEKSALGKVAGSNYLASVAQSFYAFRGCAIVFVCRPNYEERVGSCIYFAQLK